MSKVRKAIAETISGVGLPADKLFSVVYEELRRIARYQMSRERASHTLQATALVNEAFLKLVSSGEVKANDQKHFKALASRVMRRLLVDHAKAKRADKRGGGFIAVTLTENVQGSTFGNADLTTLNESLEKLLSENQRAAQVVEYRFFGGMTFEEIAELLGISLATAKRDWELARLWLYHEIQSSK